MTLTTLRARYGDDNTWETQTVDCAKPKNGPRRLHENRESGVYIAETIVAGMVRETEVVFTKLRTDGQLDFAVYTPDGVRADRSTFTTASGGAITSAAPYTCMSCHIDTSAESFSDRMPVGTGAGCK